MRPSPRNPRRGTLLSAVFATAALLALGACQKDRLYGERKPVGKAYHAFTSKYNAYFNANELIEEAEQELAAATPADYGEILPVFPAYAVSSAQSASSKLDQAMEKVSLTVNIHRPNAFEDDAYLLLGRAQLLKQDYESAQHTLEYSVKDFAPENEAARLRRIEKERIADEKKRAKASGERAAPTRRNAPRRRTSAPQRRKSSRAKRPSRRKSGAERPSRSKSSRDSRGRSKTKRGGMSEREKAQAREEAVAARKAAAKERDEAEAAAEDDKEATAKERRLANEQKRESRKKKAPTKKKSRAEMAKEQREARMAEEKAALREAERVEREAESDERAGLLAEERAETKAREAAAAKQAAADAKAAEELAARDAENQDLDNALIDGEGLAAADDEDRPKHGIFVHEKALQDFDYWLARTYIARERYLDAERLLGRLARSGSTWKRLRRQLPATYADMYLRREMLAEAVPYLEDAVALAKKKLDRARYAFILGQVQQRLGDADGAMASFAEVVRLKPAFDMAFNAELSLMTTEYRLGKATSAATLKRLKRMSKEDKYDVYRDQIFYEMADMSLLDGDREAGIAYMRQSLANNNGNARQAAKGYRRLADLFLEDEDYVLASAYYDSTAQVLPTDDDAYPEVVAYRDNLSPVAASLSAIALQDSLLAVAAMSPEEQRELALKIDEQRRAEALAAAIEAVRQANAPQRRGSNPQDAIRGGLTRGRQQQGDAVIADFFAYDAKAVRRGEKEFRREWGDRQLVDNWRTLSARESLAARDDIDALRPGAVSEEDVDVEGILADVPNTPEAKDAANAIIEAALISLGRDYREKLDNPERAAEALAELLRRFPETEDAAEALYLLALAQDDMGQGAAADATRARLRREHPGSKYARSLAEPDFFDEAKGAEKALVDYYDETYRLFTRDQAAAARTRLTSAPGTFGEEHALMPRFALLSAQVAGKIDGRDAYITALKEVVGKYPDAEEGVKAKEILRLLGERSSTASALDQAADTGGGAGQDVTFDTNMEQAHYFLAVLPKGANMSESRAKVADFNGEHHRLEKLAVSNVSMVRDGQPTPVVVVRRFKTVEAAQKYFDSVTGKQEAFLGGLDFEPALISQANYREVLRKKSFAEYLRFFAEAY